MKDGLFFMVVLVTFIFSGCANNVSDKHPVDDEAVNDDTVNDEAVETDSITDDIAVTDDQNDETIPDNDDIYVPDDDSTDGCANSIDCGEGFFCLKSDGACTEKGVCIAIPQDCDFNIAEPVCGCDGNTYKNSCYAQMAGTGVMHPGGCGSMVECNKNSDCLETEYCHKEQGVCDENAKGQCDLKRDEQECWMYSAIIYVCGCDGVTYQHPCFASSAGTTIAYEGECE
ncbi:MAG TPA: hypothetical protein PKG52_13095 [bacterium]|nr:hypothetical protein [bacterium]